MLNDQKQRHPQNSYAAKLARARAYLQSLNIMAVQQGNVLRYEPAEHGSKVLRPLRRRAA